ncbi:MAG: D-aminoacyl-tRNA deacylase [Candidatus Tritonobacter lacicola]|nr:D-aminoacyl-tRNA deacylase [Candidatus Tritonobacter lacicola]
MRAVVQRVTKASVTIDGKEVSSIGRGLLILLGVAKGASEEDADWLASKIANLRTFPDKEGKMNLSSIDISGEILVVSQFTLLADCSRGRRPGFDKAAEPETANSLYNRFVRKLKDIGITVKTGQFAAKMIVELVNDGPVTFVIESKINSKS